MEIWQIILLAIGAPIFMAVLLYMKLHVKRSLRKNKANRKREATIFLSSDEYEMLKSSQDGDYAVYRKRKEEISAKDKDL